MTIDQESGRKDLMREDIDAVLAFLPVLEQPGLKFGEWHPYRDERTDTPLPIGYSNIAPEVQAFLHALYEHHWVYPFDYLNRAWQKRMFALRDDPERMARARLETMRKMLITYARMDYWIDSTLAEACEQGYIQAILRRVKEITEGRI